MFPGVEDSLKIGRRIYCPPYRERGRYVFDRIQRTSRVAIRRGTSSTGISAVIFRAAVDTKTPRVAELEMYTHWLSGSDVHCLKEKSEKIVTFVKMLEAALGTSAGSPPLSSVKG
jgi:hypothetical protein